jgi:hypothetical protein
MERIGEDVRRADIKVGDHLNWIDPTDSYGRDCEVIVLSDVPWTMNHPSQQHSTVETDIDGVIANVSVPAGTRPTDRGNGVLVVFADDRGKSGGLVLQLRYLHPWTEENEAKAVAARELDKEIRRNHMKSFRDKVKS